MQQRDVCNMNHLLSLVLGSPWSRLQDVARYRSGFTINYRALFPDESRNYRVDILEASVEQNAVIWAPRPQRFFDGSTDVHRHHFKDGNGWKDCRRSAKIW